MLEKFGYLPDIRFNTVIDMALKRQGLKRSDIYVTQTFHLIPQGRRDESVEFPCDERSHPHGDPNPLCEPFGARSEFRYRPSDALLTKLLNMSSTEGKSLHWAVLLLGNAPGTEFNIGGVSSQSARTYQ
jgi:hypothetical protein